MCEESKGVRLVDVKKFVTTTIMIGDQPSEADLRELKSLGFVGVVNLRNDGEPEQPISPSREGDLARALGLEYLHHGVGAAPLDEACVAAVSDFIARHAQGTDQVLVHCRRGGRAVALVVLHFARVHGWTAEEVAERALEMGLAVDGGLRLMVEGWLRANPCR